MISISNLVFRMKKCSWSMTIAILSSMVLVTLVGAASIYAGKKDYLASATPHDYSVTGNKVDLTSTKSLWMISLIKTGEQANEEVAVSYLLFGIKNQETNKLTVLLKMKEKLFQNQLFWSFSRNL